MGETTRSIELHHSHRGPYAEHPGAQITVVLAIRGDGGAVTLDVISGWALVPFGGDWELSAGNWAPRDDGMHVHLDPCARLVDDTDGSVAMPECSFTPSGRCRHDVGGLVGRRLAVLLMTDGPDAVFDELENVYRQRIGDPQPRRELLDDLGDADEVGS